MFLRKHIEKGVIKNIETLNEDRVIQITVNNRNEIGDLKDYYLIIELFGRYANLIILDENKVIINAYQHIHPFENPDRIIVNGIKYSLPPDDKISPSDLAAISNFFNHNEISYQDIINNIRGLSPLFAKHLLKTSNYNHKNMFEVYKNLLNEESKPTESGKSFYFLDIFQEDKRYFESLSKLLEIHYENASSLDRVKQIHKYLNTIIKNNYEKSKNKLEKLSKDLSQAKDNQINRIKGDLLLQYQHDIDKSKPEIDLYSYELEKNVNVNIDRTMSVIENANKFYTKYKKQKNAISFIEEQINLTKKDILYFENLLVQIDDNFNIKDLEEIQDELIYNKYILRKKPQNKNKKPNYDTYYDELGIPILVGKNNLQNNYITHKISKKDHMWFHVQNQSGSHTVVQSDSDLNETTIRTAANLAAYFSKSKHSSSVPVDYTKIRYVKKIPGEFGSYVSYTNQKTIYIDPDIELIKKLRKG